MSRFAPLAGVLRRMLACYRDVREAGERKNAALVASDFLAVDTLGRREKELADRLLVLERERKAAAAGIEPDGGVRTLRELIARHAGEPDTGEVATLRTELLTLSGQVAELNRRNLALVQKSLEIVDFTLKTVRNLVNRDAEVYNRRGYEGHAAGAEHRLTLFDVKA